MATVKGFEHGKEYNFVIEKAGEYTTTNGHKKLSFRVKDLDTGNTAYMDVFTEHASNDDTTYKWKEQAKKTLAKLLGWRSVQYISRNILGRLIGVKFVGKVEIAQEKYVNIYPVSKISTNGQQPQPQEDEIHF